MKRTQAVAPVDATPNTAPFPYRDFVVAKNDLESAIKKGPFYGLVIGASGTGKTSLCRDLCSGLDRHQHQLLYFSAPRVSLFSIARYFARALRVRPKPSSLETMKVIADVVSAQPAQLVVWIDDADALPQSTLAELRSLAEVSHEVAQIFTMVFSGPSELRALLDQPSLFPLKRRIALRCKLEGLRRDELNAFLAHRFGADHQRLPPALGDELFERARAVPALLDRIARRALERADRGAVSEEHLREAFDVEGF